MLAKAKKRLKVEGRGAKPRLDRSMRSAFNAAINDSPARPTIDEPGSVPAVHSFPPDERARGGGVRRASGGMTKFSAEDGDFTDRLAYARPLSQAADPKMARKPPKTGDDAAESVYTGNLYQGKDREDSRIIGLARGGVMRAPRLGWAGSKPGKGRL